MGAHVLTKHARHCGALCSTRFALFSRAAMLAFSGVKLTEWQRHS
jgi:hypothetical protein